VNHRRPQILPRTLSLYTHNSGTSLAFATIFLIALLGFLGMAIYTGMTAYVQGELQKAITTSALVGATAYYDPPYATTDYAPEKNSTNAEIAANRTFEHIVPNTPLANFGVTPAALTVNPSPNSDALGLEATASIQTPFLSPLGINSLNIAATARARYVKYLIQNPVNLNPFTNAKREELIVLRHPLIDGPGPDLKIESGPTWHGYIVEACNERGNTCYDISNTARLVDPEQGGIVDRTYPNGARRRVLYGDTYLDLGAIQKQNLGPHYSNRVFKASYLKIKDDGIPDRVEMEDGLPKLIVEFNPSALTLERIEIYHLAVSCPPPPPDNPGMETCPNTFPSEMALAPMAN
jgi:hypothetical protein